MTLLSSPFDFHLPKQKKEKKNSLQLLLAPGYVEKFSLDGNAVLAKHTNDVTTKSINLIILCICQ